MKIFGAVLLSLAAFLLIRCYKGFIDRGALQAEAFSELLVELKRQISVSGMPIDRIVSGYKSKALSEVGFFDEYKKTGSLASAFFAVQKRLSVPREIGQAVGRIFEGIGRGTLAGELRHIDDGIGEMKGMITGYKTEAQRSVRHASVVTVAVLLGLLIILV